MVLWLRVRDWIICVVNFQFPLHEVFAQNQWGHKILRSSWGLRHWQSKFNYCYDGILTCFSILILWTNEGEAENMDLFIFVLWRCLNRRWMRVGGCGRKSYLGPAEITSFSSRDFSRSSKHGIFWHALSTGYFYVLLLWTIAASEKNLGFP